MQRITIPLDSTGHFDLDSGREKHVSAFIDAMKAMDPDQLRQLGLQPVSGEVDSPGSSAEGVTLENVAQGLDWITSFNARLFQQMVGRFVKNPFVLIQGKPAPLRIDDQTAELFNLTAKQHEELDPRALRIAQQYERKLPDWIKKHFDLYMLVTMYISYMSVNGKAVIGTQIKKDFLAVQAKQQPRNPQPDSDRKEAQPVNGVDKNPPPEFDGGLPDVPEVPLA